MRQYIKRAALKAHKDTAAIENTVRQMLADIACGRG
jgi:hypothetical protein